MEDCRTVTDSDRIRNLLGRYCDLMDAGDWPGVGALFAHARLADEHGVELAAGAEAVTAFYAAGTRLHDGSPRTKHLVTNTVLDAPAADGTVTARSSYLVLQATDDLPLQPIITGRYVDRFAPTAGDEPAGSEPAGDEPAGDQPAGHEPAEGAPGGDEPAPDDRGAEAWRFVERRFAVDLVGDLSHHLRYAL